MEPILGWKDLMQRLPALTESELVTLINYEVARYHRHAIIRRLHARYSKLRAARERELLVAGEMML